MASQKPRERLEVSSIPSVERRLAELSQKPSKPSIGPIPTSSVLSKLQRFLPQLAAANTSLSEQMKERPPSDFDIEHVAEGEDVPHIEMDLSCGVLDLLDSNSLAAAERAMSGQGGIHGGALGLGADRDSDADSDEDDSSSDSGDDNAIGRDVQWGLMTRGPAQHDSSSGLDGMSMEGAASGSSEPAGSAQAGNGRAKTCGAGDTPSGSQAEGSAAAGGSKVSSRAGQKASSSLDCGPGLMAGLHKKGKAQRRHKIEELS